MIVALVCGILFSLIAQYVRLNTFDKIIATALLKNSDVIEILLFAIGISNIAFFIEYLFGAATIEIKPFYVVGVSIGGTLFGAGVAILGYCPGTMTMALAEGKIDALFGYAGGILAGLLFTVIYPGIIPFLGPNLGPINLYLSGKIETGIVVLAYALLLTTVAFKLSQRKT